MTLCAPQEALEELESEIRSKADKKRTTAQGWK